MGRPQPTFLPPSAFQLQWNEPSTRMQEPFQFHSAPASLQLPQAGDSYLSGHQDILESVEGSMNPPASPWPHMPPLGFSRAVEQSPRPYMPEGSPSIEDLDADKDKPYAQLIFDCLYQAEGHCMVLRDIYDWFKTKTSKGSDPNAKGWQNSIRHNLSMNRVRVRFVRLDNTLT